MLRALLWLGLTLLVLALLALGWVGLRGWAARLDVRGKLPDPPPVERLNAVSRKRLADAFAAARAETSADSVGTLGMVLHAYQFHDQARQAYRLARELAPREFRWTYYQAVLEEAIQEYDAAETLFERATELDPLQPDAWARLGDLRLKRNRTASAVAAFERALVLDPIHPLASQGRARLATLAQDWQAVRDILYPVVKKYPRLSAAHSYLARAEQALGNVQAAAEHAALASYGSAADGALLEALYELAVPAILHGDPAGAAEVMLDKCTRCHTPERIQATHQPPIWWARTVRRMQRNGGPQMLTEAEAAALVAYLAEPTPGPADSQPIDE